MQTKFNKIKWDWMENKYGLKVMLGKWCGLLWKAKVINQSSSFDDIFEPSIDNREYICFNSDRSYIYIYLINTLNDLLIDYNIEWNDNYTRPTIWFNNVPLEFE